MKEITIELDYFYGKDDLIIKINRETFEKICFDLFIKIEKTFHSVIDEEGINFDNIDEVILVGGATKMISIKNFLRKYFNPEKIKLNSKPENAVAYGATLDLIKKVQNNKIKFNLVDLVACNLGVETINNEMSTIIKKFSKIPAIKSKDYKIILTEENPNISIYIYEGNDKLVKYNRYLGEIILDGINKFGEILYNIKFIVNEDYKLTVNVKIESLGIEKKDEIQNITHALIDKVNKKIRVLYNRRKIPIFFWSNK